MNRRFVAYFYNRSGHGEGGNAKAAAFTKGKTENPYAFMAAFKADGTIVGETELYADKDAVFEWLRQLLAKHPDLGKATDAERAVLERAKERSKDCTARLAGAVLHEQLGDYDPACAGYEFVVSSGSAEQRAQALTALLRIARYRKQWDVHESNETALTALIAGEGDALAMHRFDAAAERGYRLVAKDEFAEARKLLQPLTKEATQSPRLAELHFTCGVACWFAKRRDWAKFHWCWIVEHMPDDRLHRRAYITAAAEAMPYANFELRNYSAKVGNIGTHSIVQGVRRAMKVYEELKPAYDVGEFDHGAAARGGGLRQFR